MNLSLSVVLLIAIWASVMKKVIPLLRPRLGQATKTVEASSNRRAQRRDTTVSPEVPSPPSKRQRRQRQHPQDKYSPTQQEAISFLKERLGETTLFHATGNPLAVRSPTTPPTLAVDRLVAILKAGVIGQQSSSATSTSTPQLLTERGTTSRGCFWTDRFKLAGQYGWTGLILPGDADTSQAFDVANALWILLETEEDRLYLKEQLVKVESLQEGHGDDDDDYEEDEDHATTTTDIVSAMEDKIVTLTMLQERFTRLTDKE